MLLWKIYGPNRNIAVDDKSPMNFRGENRWPELIHWTLFTWSWWQTSWLKYVQWKIDMKVLCFATQKLSEPCSQSHGHGYRTKSTTFFLKHGIYLSREKKPNNRRNEYLISLCRFDIFIHQTFSHYYYICDRIGIRMSPQFHSGGESTDQNNPVSIA